MKKIKLHYLAKVNVFHSRVKLYHILIFFSFDIFMILQTGIFFKLQLNGGAQTMAAVALSLEFTV